MDYLVSKYSEVVHEHEKFQWGDLLLFRKQFWYTCLSCMFMQIAINNSITIGSSVLQIRYGFSITEAGFIFTLPYVIAAIFSPILGLIVEKFGHRNQVSIAGSCCMVIAHSMQLFIPDC
jgi:MFS family permease